MTKMSSAVRKVSMKRPCAMEVEAPRVVATLRGPGKSADTMPAAAMEERSWAMRKRKARRGLRAPMRRRPRVTCGCVRGFFFWSFGECGGRLYIAIYRVKGGWWERKEDKYVRQD